MNKVEKKSILQSTPAKVVERKKQTFDTFLFRIKLNDVNQKTIFEKYYPGQFAIIGIDGTGECPISITSSCGVSEYLEFCIRSVGSVTREICAMGEGDEIKIRGPYGHPFPFNEIKGKNLLFVAGGIGIAPLRSLINAVINERQLFGNISIVYGAKTAGDLCFKEEFKTWGEKADLYITVDKATEEWTGHVGLVPDFVDEIGLRQKKDWEVFICGPPIMIKIEMERFLKAGFDPGRCWTTIERKMRCGVGKCCRCMVGSKYVCLDGPVFTMAELLKIGVVP